MRQPALQLADGAQRVLGAPPARQHVVDDQAEGVHVGALIDVLATRLFRGHVFDRADDLPRRLSPLTRVTSSSTATLELTGGGGGPRGDRPRCRSRDPEVHDDRVFVARSSRSQA